jgi:Flp pilus assembly protein CpaB
MGAAAPPSRLSTAVRGLRRAVSRHRRLLAAGLAAAAVAAGLQVVSPPPPPTVRILAAARDLAGGARLTGDDVREVDMPPGLVPRGALRPGDRLLGRVVATPVRAGSPLTDVALLGRSLVAGYGPGAVAAPVRITDAGAVSLLRVGDRVDVLAAAPQGGAATDTVAAAAPVVAVPALDSDGGPMGSGALVVLAVSPPVASRLAQAAVTAQLSVVLRG